MSVDQSECGNKNSTDSCLIFAYSALQRLLEERSWNRLCPGCDECDGVEGEINTPASKS